MNRVMRKLVRSVAAPAIAVLALSSLTSPIHAQDAAKAPPLATQPAQVEVVLSRYQGEKKTSSLPFTIVLTAAPRAGWTSIRMGVDVPVGTSTSNVTQTSNAQSSSPRAVETTKSVTEFRNIGTSIDAQVNRVDEANYSVGVQINDSALFSPEPGKIPSGLADPTAFRTFSTSNTLPMKDGQTRLFGMATDKITGETLKIEVKLTILK
jgi:hypothetical protein